MVGSKGPVPSALLQPIVSRLAPEQVWLFGSRARNEEEPRSDWDLLAVLPDSAPDDWLDDGYVWEQCTRLLPLPTDLVVVRRRDFVEMRRYAGSLCRTVALEGTLVHGDAVPPNPVALGSSEPARRIWMPCGGSWLPR